MDITDNLKLFEQREKHHKELMTVFQNMSADIAFMKKLFERLTPAPNALNVRIVTPYI